MKLTDKFAEWLEEYKPGELTQAVLQRLLIKYQRGDMQLFEKFLQLERDEHFELCTHFKSMFDFMELNNDFKLYKANISPPLL